MLTEVAEEIDFGTVMICGVDPGCDPTTRMACVLMVMGERCLVAVTIRGVAILIVLVGVSPAPSVAATGRT